AGESSDSKRVRVGGLIAKNDVDAAVIAAPDSVAWLLNIRGGDVSHTPLALSFAILHKSGKAQWFIDERKISSAVRDHVGKDVSIHALAALADEIQMLGAKNAVVQVDYKRNAAWFVQKLQSSGAVVLDKDDPCLLPKACKNAVEVEGIRQAHIRDGVALSSFLAWLDSATQQAEVTELEAEEKLLQFRKQQKDFKEPSFDTIAGSAEHGAIVHYRATEQSNKVLAQNTLFLCDSGGQYLDGTTDVTRTVVIGQPTNEQKRRFTQVLKGHIAIAQAVFPAGICGRNLDVLARSALWAEGLDYAHGTGHGVGAYLGVHEGPQGIHLRSDVPLEVNMVLSNEPGFYKEGEYGIRIENLVVVTEQTTLRNTTNRPFYGFETLTLAPIDRRLIATELLTTAEIAWLDAYHARVYMTLSSKVEDNVKRWLGHMTQPLNNATQAPQTKVAM
ncbi:MAG: aminopeptidase P family protein, partial [Alphaproteobacteria bacterium]|nr:aminopeptidase P family protein [Alphaproteobacteria bacterium]